MEESGTPLLRPRMACAVAKNGFTMVFDEVMDHPDLSLLAVNIVCYMERKAWDGRWTGGTQMLADLFKGSKSQVRREIVILEAAGFIEVTNRKVGQRFSYRLLRLQNKAGHPGPLSETESGPPRRGVGLPGAVVSHPGPRMRERPSESKKNHPTLLEGGGERISSETGTEEKKKSRKVVASPELREAVVALFYGPIVPSTQMRHFNRYVNDLALLSATPAEVRERHKRWPTVFPNAGACTLRSLVKHWGVLAPPPPNPYDLWAGKPPTVPPRDEP